MSIFGGIEKEVSGNDLSKQKVLNFNILIGGVVELSIQYSDTFFNVKCRHLEEGYEC